MIAERSAGTKWGRRGHRGRTKLGDEDASSPSAPGRHDQGRGERGFTLIELIIVCTIVPVIIGALSAGLITLLNLQHSVAGRVQDSSDAQVVSSTFIKDVQSATSMTTLATSTPQCGSTSYTQLLGLQWGGGQTVVSYDVVPVVSGSTTNYTLVREYCTQGNTTTPSAASTAAFDITSPTDATNPQLPPCLTGATCTPDGTTQGWTMASAVPAAKFVLDEAASGLTYTLLAGSRAWTPVTAQNVPVGPAFAPVTVLSPGCSGCTVFSLLQDSDVTVNPSPGTGGGTLAIASTFAGSVSIPDDAGLSVPTIVTSDAKLDSVSGAGIFPATEYYSPVVVDPFSNVFTTPPQLPGNTGACTNPNGLNYSCGPGKYSPSALIFPNGANVTFKGNGDYEFTSNFVIPSSVTMTFDLGDYTFDGSSAITPFSLASQAITFTTTNPTSASNGTYTPTATSSAGLAVEITNDASSTGCTFNAGTGVFTFTGSGVCRIDANQAGNTTYGQAAEVQQSVTVPSSGRSKQTISFTSPNLSPVAVGAPNYTPVATSTAGRSVSFSVDPASSGCSMNFGTVDFNATGTCLIDANEGATGTFLAAAQVQQAIYVTTPGNATIVGNDVLFYVPNGSVNFGNNTAVNLAPIPGNDGVTIWDGTGNAATAVSIVNIQDNRNSYGGIYIPGGAVNVSSSGYDGATSVLFVIANTISVATHTDLIVTGP